MYQIVNFADKKPVTFNNLVFTGKDSPWEVLMDLDIIKSKIYLDYFKIATPSLAKYLPFMPIKDSSQFISLHEAATPLIKSKSIGKKLGIDLYFKHEAKNPTGSFKDRGSAVDVTVAKEFNAKGIVVASTGNMAASCACYAAAANIPCFIFVPEGVPVSKLAQVIAFGGRIVQIKGTYNDCAFLAEKIAEKMGFYLAGDYAFRVEGQKTAAFEIIDQMFFHEPDVVIVPIGCGTNITAYAKGFQEYRALGLIEKMPKLFGVQATGACAVVNSFLKNRADIQPLSSAQTIATAIAVPNPIDGIKALDAIYSTDGDAIAVTDQEMLQAQYQLATEEGLFVESASSATLAALLKKYDGKLENKKIVCVLTGDGLKDPSIILKTAIKPPTIYPEEKEFLSLYQNGFFESKPIFVDQDQIVFKQESDLKQLKHYLQTISTTDYSEDYIEKIQRMIIGFLQKGKVVTLSDLQDILQDTQETLRSKKKECFVVTDFETKTGKDRIPEASVTVKFADGEHSASAKGVGPVDAVINALCKACQDEIAFKLTDYKVEIRNKGVDAAVYVELKLIKGNSISLGRGTSPDIIQASIEAFQEAYNGFL